MLSISVYCSTGLLSSNIVFVSIAFTLNEQSVEPICIISVVGNNFKEEAPVRFPPIFMFPFTSKSNGEDSG